MDAFVALLILIQNWTNAGCVELFTFLRMSPILVWDITLIAGMGAAVIYRRYLNRGAENRQALLINRQELFNIVNNVPYPTKGKDFQTIEEEHVQMAINRLNNRPRKTLGYKTPNEVFFKEITKQAA